MLFYAEAMQMFNTKLDYWAYLITRYVKGKGFLMDEHLAKVWVCSQLTNIIRNLSEEQAGIALGTGHTLTNIAKAGGTSQPNVKTKWPHIHDYADAYKALKETGEAQDVIIDNRLETSGEGFGSLVTEQPAYYSGDFVSPEQILPPEGIRNVCGERVPWELCTTMNNNWGYNPYDTDYKPAAMLIRKLVECVSKGGNMILNVGPDANGRFNLESCRLLDEIGTWLAVNGESIYGCGSADVPKPDWGWYTKKDGRIYAHILENPIGPLALTGLDAKRVGAVRRLADGSEVLRGESWITNAYENLAFVTLGTIPHFTYMLPDPTDTVLEIEYKDACL